MANFIIKLTDKNTDISYYLMYCTVWDKPITNGMLLDDFTKWYRDKYGAGEIDFLPERMQRVENNNTSGHHPYDDLDILLCTNRAGNNEGHITTEDIINRYCIKKRYK